MKFNQYAWNLYKQSPNVKKAIEEFKDTAKNTFQPSLVFRYNFKMELWDNNEEKLSFIEDIGSGP